MQSGNYLIQFVAYFVLLILLSCGPAEDRSTQQIDSADTVSSDYVSQVWVADNGDGTYKNPILHADYSDPDAVRVGDDFYMTSSSFNCVPGLPILHSRDLVNWRIINHAFQLQYPYEHFSEVRNGEGVWAPAIRHHNGEFYIFYGDPDFGVYMYKTEDPAGEWEGPHLVQEGKGWIDPCPLWDEDGKAYLVSAFARSRSGIKSVILVSEMSPDGTTLIGDPVVVFDGHENHPTIEGPKFYKRDGYYYIFAPGGGVTSGWQTVLRSENIYGPYEDKIVLAQGDTDINGPHQGAWVDTPSGEDWFLHFQDKEPYGRIVHLQPMRWEDGWPVMGTDEDGDGTGEPVLTYQKPDIDGDHPVFTPVESDEFNEPGLGLQWQWHANPEKTYAFPSGRKGFFRLYCQPLPEDFVNFWTVPYLLMQKFPAPEFSATTKISFTPMGDGSRAGLIVSGRDYAYIDVKKEPDGLYIAQTICEGADEGEEETKGIGRKKISRETFYLRVQVENGGLCHFSYSENGEAFESIGEPFQAREGQWIGSKVGLFAIRDNETDETGFADADWFRIH